MSAELSHGRFVSLLGHAVGKQRARALDGLLNELPALAQDQVAELFPKILAMAGNDPSDACRERAAALLLAALSRTADRAESLPAPVAEAVAELAERRLAPGAEQTEEVRLAVLQALHCVVSRFAPGTLARRNDAVKAAVIGGVADRFDDVKLVACALAESFAQRDPQRAFMVGDTLVAAITIGMPQPQQQQQQQHGLFVHRKHAVRLAALAAVGALVECGCVRGIEDVARQIVRLGCDPSATIRLAVVAACRRICVGAGIEFAELLLPALLTCISDESQDVSKSALEALADVGDRFLTLYPAKLPEQQDDFKPLPAIPQPFTERPSAGARALVQHTLKKTLSWTLDNAVDVIDVVGGGGALRSLVVLRNIAVLSETAILSVLEPVLEFLCEAATSKDSHEVALVSDVAAVVGWFSGPAAFIPRVLPSVQDVSKAVAHRAASCCVLVGLVNGCDRAALAPFLHQLIGAALSALDQQSLVLCGYALDLLVSVAPLCAGNEELSVTLFSALLDFVQATEAVSRLALAALEKIAPHLAAGCTTSASLFDHFLPKIFERLSLDASAPADMQLASLLRLRTLVRGSSDALSVAETAGTVSRIVWTIAAHPKEEVRLQALRLACDAIAKTPHACVNHFATPEAANLLVDSLNWKTGLAAASMRSVASDCLVRLLALCTPDLVAFLSRLAAATTKLAEAMDDRDAATRANLSTAMRYLVSLHPTIEGESAFSLATAFEKRLDDTEDAIRITATQALALLLSLPPACASSDTIAGTVNQLIRKLFVHLDDFNPAVQQAVFAALKHLAPVHPVLVQQLAEEMAHKHRSPSYCKELNELACTQLH